MNTAVAASTFDEARELATDASLYEPAQATTRQRPRVVWRQGVAAGLVWAGLAGLTGLWPNKEIGFSDWAYTQEFAWLCALAALLLLTLALLAGSFGRTVAWLRPAGPWLIALPAALALWQVLTAKLGVLPPPFFAPPQSLLEVYLDDTDRLLTSVLHSLRLLVIGIALGALTGFVLGVWIGWSRIAGYWVHPLLRFLGPVPASALLPLAFFFAPSSFSAAIFLIALATFFPVAVLTWSGVANVNKSYYDVARTLGASEWFLVLRAAFSVLITAEMMGVKAGLGWYLQWAQGWAAYANMYGALLVMAVLCSGLITLLFAVRDRVLTWQKGTVKW